MRPLNDQKLVQLVKEVFDPRHPLLVGLHQGRVRRYRTYLRPVTLINSSKLFADNSSGCAIDWNSPVNGWKLIYGIERDYFKLDSYDYFLGSEAKVLANHDSLLMTRGMADCYNMLRVYMWRPDVNPRLKEKHKRMKWQPPRET